MEAPVGTIPRRRRTQKTHHRLSKKEIMDSVKSEIPKAKSRPLPHANSMSVMICSDMTALNLDVRLNLKQSSFFIGYEQSHIRKSRPNFQKIVCIDGAVNRFSRHMFMKFLQLTRKTVIWQRPILENRTARINVNFIFNITYIPPFHSRDRFCLFCIKKTKRSPDLILNSPYTYS